MSEKNATIPEAQNVGDIIANKEFFFAINASNSDPTNSISIIF